MPTLSQRARKDGAPAHTTRFPLWKLEGFVSGSNIGSSGRSTPLRQKEGLSGPPAYFSKAREVERLSGLSDDFVPHVSGFTPSCPGPEGPDFLGAFYAALKGRSTRVALAAGMMGTLTFCEVVHLAGHG